MKVHQAQRHGLDSNSFKIRLKKIWLRSLGFTTFGMRNDGLSSRPFCSGVGFLALRSYIFDVAAGEEDSWEAVRQLTLVDGDEKEGGRRPSL